MSGTDLNISDQDRSALRALAQLTGKSENDLISEAVGQFLTKSQPKDRLKLLRSAKGIWKDREDLPDFAELRAEWDRLPT